VNLELCKSFKVSKTNLTFYWTNTYTRNPSAYTTGEVYGHVIVIKLLPLQRSVCMSVLCVQNISKVTNGIWWIFGGFGNNRLDFGGDPDLLPLFCPNFHPRNAFSMLFAIIRQVGHYCRRRYAVYRITR